MLLVDGVLFKSYFFFLHFLQTLFLMNYLMLCINISNVSFFLMCLLFLYFFYSSNYFLLSSKFSNMMASINLSKRIYPMKTNIIQNIILGCPTPLAKLYINLCQLLVYIVVNTANKLLRNPSKFTLGLSPSSKLSLFSLSNFNL